VANLTELPEYLSASSISTFEQCPLKYKLSRVDKIKEPPTRETLLGVFVHEVMEKLYADSADTGRTTFNAKQISAEIWAAGNWVDQVTPYLKGMTMQTFRWNAWWCIENLFKVENPLAIDVQGIEYELNSEIEGVKIKGFIDRLARIDGSDTISDYKTGKTPKDKYLGDKFFQLLLYFICLSKTQTMQDPKLELLYLKDAERRVIEPTPELCAEAIETVVTVNTKIQTCNNASQWEAIPSNLCNWCFFKYNGCTIYTRKTR